MMNNEKEKDAIDTSKLDEILPKYDPLKLNGINLAQNYVSAFNTGMNIYQCVNQLQGYIEWVVKAVNDVVKSWNVQVGESIDQSKAIVRETTTEQFNTEWTNKQPELIEQVNTLTTNQFNEDWGVLENRINTTLETQNSNIQNIQNEQNELETNTNNNINEQNIKINSIQNQQNELETNTNKNINEQNTKINSIQTQQTTLSNRMDTFTSLSEGSTTGDAELKDIRVGANGVTYNNAGDAVRGQYSQLKEDIDNLYNGKVALLKYGLNSNGTINKVLPYFAHTNYKYTSVDTEISICGINENNPLVVYTRKKNTDYLSELIKFTTDSTFIVPANNYYVYVVEGTSEHDANNVETLFEKINILNPTLKGKIFLDKNNFTVNNSGILLNGNVGNYNGWLSTPFIELNGIKTLSNIKLCGYKGIVSPLAFYNNNQFISSINENDGYYQLAKDVYPDKTFDGNEYIIEIPKLEVPEGATQIRCSFLANILDTSIPHIYTYSELFNDLSNCIYTDDSIFAKLIRTSSVIYDKLKNKKWAVLGDSRSASGYLTKTKYFDFISKQVGGMNLENFAVSGSRMNYQADTASDQPSLDCDIISVYCGVNDWGQADPTPLGTFSDDITSDTFYAKVKKICKNLLTKYPKALIVFITSQCQVGFSDFSVSGKNANSLGFTIDDYNNAIKECCSYYSIKVYDDANEGGYTPLIDQQRTLYFVDGLHQSELGQNKLAINLLGFLIKNI